MGLRFIARLVVVSVIIVGLTPLFTPVMVAEISQLGDLRFGAPLTFIVQSSHLTPPADWFPHKLTVLSLWENPTQVLWGRFAASVVIVGAGLAALSGVVMLARRTIQRR